MDSWTKTRSFREKNKCNIYLSVTWVNKLNKRSLTLSGNQESRFMELFRKMCQPLPRLLGSKFQSLKEWLIWYEDMFKKCVTLNRNACTNISEFTDLGIPKVSVCVPHECQVPTLITYNYHCIFINLLFRSATLLLFLLHLYSCCFLIRFQSI